MATQNKSQTVLHGLFCLYEIGSETSCFGLLPSQAWSHYATAVDLDRPSTVHRGRNLDVATPPSRSEATRANVDILNQCGTRIQQPILWLKIQWHDVNLLTAWHYTAHPLTSKPWLLFSHATLLLAPIARVASLRDRQHQVTWCCPSRSEATRALCCELPTEDDPALMNQLTQPPWRRPGEIYALKRETLDQKINEGRVNSNRY